MFLIDNRFQNLGRSNLGLSAKNMGDSICFRATVLRQIGWGEGLTDDYQLWQRLLLAGIRIVYEPGAIGYGEAAPNLVQARNQRTRWLRGTRNASQKVRWRLLMEGVRHRNPAQIDGAFQAYFPSYSTLTLIAGVLLFLQLLVNWIAGPFFSAALVTSWAVIMVILFLYPFFGLALAKAPLRAYLAILFGPFYIVWRTWLALTARLSRTPVTWLRTPHGEK
jgi:cellulose synthase/poly-beta-1,6-N-acetylglucosamine synthase-like glycosyltransferase